MAEKSKSSLVKILDLRTSSFDGREIKITRRELALGRFRIEWDYQGDHYTLYSHYLDSPQSWAEFDCAEDIADGTVDDCYYKPGVVEIKVIEKERE